MAEQVGAMSWLLGAIRPAKAKPPAPAPPSPTGTFASAAETLQDPEAPLTIDRLEIRTRRPEPLLAPPPIAPVPLASTVNYVAHPPRRHGPGEVPRIPGPPTTMPPPTVVLGTPQGPPARRIAEKGKPTPAPPLEPRPVKAPPEHQENPSAAPLAGPQAAELAGQEPPPARVPVAPVPPAPPRPPAQTVEAPPGPQQVPRPAHAQEPAHEAPRALEPRAPVPALAGEVPPAPPRPASPEAPPPAQLQAGTAVQRPPSPEGPPPARLQEPPAPPVHVAAVQRPASPRVPPPAQLLAAAAAKAAPPPETRRVPPPAELFAAGPRGPPAAARGRLLDGLDEMGPPFGRPPRCLARDPNGAEWERTAWDLLQDFYMQVPAGLRDTQT